MTVLLDSADLIRSSLFFLHSVTRHVEYNFTSKSGNMVHNQAVNDWVRRAQQRGVTQSNYCGMSLRNPSTKAKESFLI